MSKEHTLLFSPGKILLTPGVLDFLSKGDPEMEHPDEERGLFLAACLSNHISGDWGDLDSHDRKVNRDALRSGARLLSSYTYHPDQPDRTRIWIISDGVEPEETRARRVTTCLLPEEY